MCLQQFGQVAVYVYKPLLKVAVYVCKKKQKTVSRVPSYMDGMHGIFFFDIFLELKPTFALFKEKILFYLQH